MDNKRIVVSEEVKTALKEGKPVVALESTIITHGMEYPVNLSTAKAVEQVIRDAGAIPATIAVLKGVAHVGLTEEELEFTAKEAKSFVKATTRDLPFCLAKGLNCSTTVASTMKLAHLAGVSVFVTGGIGGVHFGAETSMDVSADLTELSRTPVVVVSAGIKSILDIGKTLEVLETMSVPVFGYKTDKLPEFFFSDGEFAAPKRVDSAEEVADIYRIGSEIQLKNGMLVTVPVPKEFEADREKVQKAIKDSLAEAESKGIKGAEVTPFLLKSVKDLTEGNSLEANVALIKNNAKIGAEIAIKMSS